MKKISKVICVVLIISVIFTGCAGLTINGNSNKESELTDAENYAAKAIESLKDTLKNPDSLQIHSMEFVSFVDNDISQISLWVSAIEKQEPGVKDVKYIYKVDYSAQNGFGGMNRETKVIPVKNDMSVIKTEKIYFGESNFNSLFNDAQTEIGSSFIDLTRIGYGDKE